MPLVKISAKGIIVKHGATATPTTALTGLKSVGLNQGARELIDVTTHDSSTTKEYIDSGLRDTPEIEMTLTYDPTDTGHEAIRAAAAAGTVYYMTFVLPDTGTAQWALVGHVMGFNIPSRGVTDALEATFTFKAKSADTFTQ